MNQMEEMDEEELSPKTDPMTPKTGLPPPTEIPRDAIAVPKRPGIAYSVAGVVMFVTVIGIPFGIQAFKLAGFSLWPFGRIMVKKSRTSAGSLVGNILWFIFAGFWLALGHLVSALLFAVTIIGIPFAIVSIRLAEAVLLPFGREVVTLEEARSRSAW
jgi:uncharacterized membrane protein YccF (DUF307 family)